MNIVLDKYDKYTILKRDTTFQPFIVAYNYDELDGTWQQGHYFNSLISAVEYVKEKQFNSDRLLEIAIKVIEGLIIDDKESAYEYLATNVEIDEEEANLLGLDNEELKKYRFCEYN